jgi:hypothetical protein
LCNAELALCQEQRIANEVIMNKNLKVLLSAVALAAVVAAPAVAKSRTQPHHTGPTQAHQNSAGVRDYQTGEILGTDPDPRIRYELRRDGSSSWEEPAG